jgi:hypothetical protein
MLKRIRTVRDSIFGQNLIYQPNYSAMKRVLLATALILTMSLVTFARKFVAEGMTNTAVGNYRIEIADNPVMINGKELKAFVITYENTNMEVTVAFDKNKQGMTYYVLSPSLSIKYVCNGKFFGIARIESELEKEGYRTSDSALNRGEYFHQKVLATGHKCDLEHTKLIAAYYPMLLNNPENALAVR